MQACPNALADEIHCNEHNASNESGHTRKQDCIYDDSDHLPHPLSVGFLVADGAHNNFGRYNPTRWAHKRDLPGFL
jgi:hypothetical protein